MIKTVLWTSLSLHSAEYFVLVPQADGFRLNGTINLLLEDQPTQVIYHIDCDLNWHTRRVAIQQRQPDRETQLILTVDTELHWYKDGTPIPWATGLTDVDLSITPSTNMLPVRKHSLKIGESCAVNCVWVQPPTLALATLPQRYTRIDSRQYDYAAPSLNYKAVLCVDEDGVIVKYGDLFEQPGIN